MTLLDHKTHLHFHQQNELAQTLEKYPTLFDGKLKVYKGQQIHLELKENVVPYRTRPYPIPHSHMDVFKQDLDRLVDIRVSSNVVDDRNGLLAPSSFRRRTLVFDGFPTSVV